MTRVVVVLCVTLVTSLAFPATSRAAYIYVDPGHGGRYSNANANGLREKDVNLAIARELRSILRARGHRVSLTRASDRTVALGDRPTWNWNGKAWRFSRDGKTGYVGGIPKDDLQARCDAANRAGADLFICIHNNGSASRRSQGTETFASARDPLGRKLSQYVQRAVVASTGLRNRGAFSMDFYVLRWTNMPAVLVEGGFITSPRDAALLRRASFRRRLARGIADGIQRFLASRPFVSRYPRLAGADRYATAALVSATGWPDRTGGTVIIASGTRWADSVAVAPLSRKLAAPVLFTALDSVPRSTAAEVERLQPSEIVVLGGPESVAESVTVTLASLLPSDTVRIRRIPGGDRYEMSALVACELTPNPSGTVFLVSGQAPAAAYSVSSYAARTGAPILLCGARDVPAATQRYLTDNAAWIRSVFVVGAPGSVAPAAIANAPSVRFLTGTTYWGVNADVLRAFHASGRTAPYVVRPVSFTDAVPAACLAAKTGQPLLFTSSRVMNARTREWITQNRWRIASFTIVGGTRTLPYAADWMLSKAVCY